MDNYAEYLIVADAPVIEVDDGVTLTASVEHNGIFTFSNIDVQNSPSSILTDAIDTSVPETEVL